MKRPGAADEPGVSRSSRTVIVLGLMALLCAAASVALAASSFHPHPRKAGPRALKVACAQKRSGMLRYVTSTARCHRGTERAVNFAQDGPVYACIRADAANGIARTAARDARGTVRRMGGPGRCGPDVQVVLPALGPRSFCVDGPTHLLRNLMGGTPCHRRGEFKVVLAKRRHRAAPKPQPMPVPQPAPDPQPAPAGNHAPVAIADAATVAEDETTAIAATANDADADGDPIHVASVATSGAKGTVAIAADGRIAYDPHGAFESLGAGESATDSFSYRATDGAAESAPASVTVTVTGADDLPVAQDDSATTTEDAARVLHVLDNDSDADGEPLHVTGLDTTGTTGSVTVSPDGTISYDPAGAFDALGPAEQATDSFTYRAADAHGSSSAATVFLTITGSDDAPVLSGIESAALAYDTGSGAAAITGAVTIADGDSATIAGARVAIVSGYVSGRDSLGFSPQNGITGSWNAGSGVLTLSGSATVAQYQDALRSVTFQATDPMPSGSRRIDITVTDGIAQSGAVSRDITLTHVNHTPSAVDDSATTNADSPTTIAVLANDTDSDLDTLGVASVDTTGTTGSVTINPDGTIAYDPAGNFDGLAAGEQATDTFAYKANDGTADSGSATVTVTIDGVNEAPVLGGIEPSALSYDTGSGPAAITSLLTAADVDSPNLGWAAVAITGGFSAGHDALTFNDQNGITGSYSAATGVLTLTGSASVADYQAALRSVTFATDATSDSGSRTISFQADDGGAVNHASAVVTRDLTITHVNHPPTTSADTAATGEDSALPAVDVLANDSDQDGDTPLHVSAIDTTGTTGDVTLTAGTISYNPAGHFDSLAAGASTTDSFKYRAADPSDADSALQTVTVTVTGVDDAPSLTQPDVTALAYGSDQAATAIVPNIAVADPDSDTLHGATIQIGSGYVSGKDVLAFAGTPSITSSWNAGTGTLTLAGDDTRANYEAALRSVKFQGDNATGVLNAARSVSFSVTDGTLTSTQAFRTIDVTHVNQAPVAGGDAYGGAVGNTTLAVSTSPSGPHTSITGNVLANDADADNAHAGLTAAAISPTATGAKVAMNSDGTFTYVPPAGASGPDSFQYTVHDNDANDPKTATGTVTIAIGSPMTWYVDAGAAGGGDGRSDAPFTSLAPLSTGGAADGKDGANDRIFVYRNASSYTSGIVLESGQALIGQSQGLTVGATTLVPASGANPAIAATGAPAATLASGADVQGLDLTAAGAPAVSGTNVATATIGSSSTIGGSGGGVALGGGSGAVTIAAPITTTGGHSVSVQDRSGGTVSVQGAVNDTGTGIQLRNDGGATIAFGGKIVAGTGTSSAFSAAGGGTVVATATGSTLTATTGTTLDVRGDTIGASNLKFQSISANGAANGILLSATGSAGGLTVTGAGTANSGGTIQSATGHAVSLSDTKNVSLNQLRIQSPLHAGVKGANVHGFSLTNSTITGAGSALSDPADASLAFNDTSGASDINVDGALTVTGNTLSGAYGGGIDVDNYAGTISNAVITNNTVSSSASATASRGSGIGLNLFGTAATVASLTRATIASNTVTNFPSGDGISVQGANTAGSGAPAGTYGIPNGTSPGTGASIVDISSNQVAGDPAAKLNGSAISAAVTGRGQGNFSIRNNGTPGSPLRNTKAEGIATGAAGAVTVNFDVEGNTVNANNVLGSAGVSLGTDKNIQADTSTLATPVVNAQFASNDISGSSGPGLRILTRDSNGTTNVRVSGNTIGNPSQGATPGIRIDAGSSGSATYNPTVCADIDANTAGTGPADGFGNVAPGILLYKRSTSSSTYRFGLPGLVPSPASAATAEALVTGNDLGSATGAGGWAGKRVAVGSGDQFTSCTLGF